jgi:hypothetical protein
MWLLTLLSHINLTTCSNKNVKKAIIKIYDGYPPPKLQVEFRKLAVFIYLPLFENDVDLDLSFVFL